METTVDHGTVSASDELLSSDSEPWEHLSIVDVSVLGFVGTLQVFALLVCAHLVRNRKWPPYVTKNPILVVIAVREPAGVGVVRARGGRVLLAVVFWHTAACSAAVPSTCTNCLPLNRDLLFVLLFVLLDIPSRAQTVSGVLWTIAMAISVGYIRRESGDILAACDFEVLLYILHP